MPFIHKLGIHALAMACHDAVGHAVVGAQECADPKGRDSSDVYDFPIGDATLIFVNPFACNVDPLDWDKLQVIYCCNAASAGYYAVQHNILLDCMELDLLPDASYILFPTRQAQCSGGFHSACDCVGGFTFSRKTTVRVGVPVSPVACLKCMLHCLPCLIPRPTEASLWSASQISRNNFSLPLSSAERAR